MLQVTQAAPLVLVPALLLTLVALWFGARQIVQPLQALEAKAADLAWGQFEAIEQPVGGIAEIRRLQAELIHMAHKVRAAQESLRDYIGAITQGQEEERRRLARELHDDTLQSLIALNQRIQLAQLALADSPAAGSLAEIQTLMEQTMSDLRRFTRALRPIYLEDLGLVAALEMLTREVGQADNLRVEFHRAGSERRLSSEVELALYRMAQEALSNVTRHAQALQVSLSITFKPDAVIMTISDNGRGFQVPASPAELAPSGHFGLLGLHERAELIGAYLDIQSSPGQGTLVIVQLPASKPSAQ
jgi:signal transduction histidine kinase